MKTSARRAALQGRHAHFPMLLKALPMVASLTLLIGCGGGGGGSSPTTTPPVTNPPVTNPPIVTPPAPTGQSVSAPALSNFTVTLSEDVSSISVGGTVRYTFTLANTSAVPATILTDISSGVSAPFVSLRISNSAGGTVYPPVSQPGLQPHDLPPPPPGSGFVTLQPGQSVSLTRALAPFSKPDTYQAVATFSVAASSADAPQTVTLSPLPLTVR